MKWFESGIQFEGTVAEYKELHDLMDMVPQRKRTGRRVEIIENDSQKRHEFLTVKEAAEFISKATGAFISPQHFTSKIEKGEVVAYDYSIKFLDQKDGGDNLELEGGENNG